VTDAQHAVHEGSHAAAALAVGVAVRSCVLCAEGGGITTLDGLDPLDPVAVKRALVICLAGEAGQRAITPPQSDWRLA
jgi:hypothetical protein